MDKFFYLEQDRRQGKMILRLWTKDGQKIIDAPMQPYCFVQCKESKLKDAITHKPVQKLEFKNTSEVMTYKMGNDTYEADVPFERRIMLDMDWKIDDVPVVYLDIETEDHGGQPKAETHKILCIGMIWSDGREEYLEGDEEQILERFIELTRNVGVIVTWNGGEDIYDSRAFDMPYIADRYSIVFDKRKQDFDYEMRHCRFFDLYQIYKFERGRIGKSLAGGLGLDNVSRAEFGVGKVKREKRIGEMSPEELKHYNLQDVKLLKMIDEKYHFTGLKIGLAQLTNSLLVSWSYKVNQRKDELKPLILIDQLVLKYARKMNLVMPNRSFGDESAVQGAMVIEPQVGIFSGVQNYDVVQMYPNVIINEKLSTDKDRVLVPTILKDIMVKRKELKKKYTETKALEDYIMQYNYKVLSNVFYGAFGNASSRIYDPKLANAVTSKGRAILQKIKDTVEEYGFKMLYGDTDSSFVQVDKDRVPALLELINNAIAPYQVEVGEYYKSIIFTGDEGAKDAEGNTKLEGKKKRYAGMTDDGDIKIVGLEAIKRDYCVLSRWTQEFVIEKLLSGTHTDNIKKCIANIRKMMNCGYYDQFLIITKSAKSLDQYKLTTKTGKQTKGLPHIRAIRKAVDRGVSQLHDISFVYTKSTDVEPVLDEKVPSDIDYDLYFERQIYAVVKTLIKSIMLQNGEWVEEKRSRRKNQSHLNAFISNTKQTTLSDSK